MLSAKLVASSLCLALITLACSRGSDINSDVRSLTGAGYTGKKYYLGWGEDLKSTSSSDPNTQQNPGVLEQMINEVNFDVKHTHDIFTSRAGGDYTATTFVSKPFTGDDIKQTWAQMRSQMTAADMYVQYSSGHGYEEGLGIQLTYKDMATEALALPAKEVIVFTMACYSGNLVDEFNAQRATWQDWSTNGRTLFVMSSSKSDELSSTGDGGSDPSSNLAGSSGSAYGHALWKSLSGEADGFIDGVKDGFVSLGEIAAYTTWKTESLGDHKPQITGVYNPYLILTRNPDAEFLANAASPMPPSEASEGNQETALR